MTERGMGKALVRERERARYRHCIRICARVMTCHCVFGLYMGEEYIRAWAPGDVETSVRRECTPATAPKTRGQQRREGERLDTGMR